MALKLLGVKISKTSRLIFVIFYSEFMRAIKISSAKFKKLLGSYPNEKNSHSIKKKSFFKVLVGPLILKLNALQPILFEIRVLLLLSFFFKKVSACVCLGCVLVFVFEIECLRVCVLGVC